MIQTAPVFTDHMVLQRDKNVAVFGTGTAGESVRVSLPAQNRTVSGCVGGDGIWCVYLPPLTAGTGMTLEVAGAENQLVYTDVAVGGYGLPRSVQHGIYAQGCQRRCGGTAALCGIRCALFPCATKHISRCGICAGICREPLGARHAGNRWRVVGGGVLGSAGAGTAPWRSGGNRRLQLWRFFCQLLDAGGGSGATRCRFCWCSCPCLLMRTRWEPVPGAFCGRRR